MKRHIVSIMSISYAQYAAKEKGADIVKQWDSKNQKERMELLRQLAVQQL